MLSSIFTRDLLQRHLNGMQPISKPVFYHCKTSTESETSQKKSHELPLAAMNSSVATGN
jgi:hypothetical protein